MDEEKNAFGVLFAKSVPHILEKIFFSLDYKSFQTCLKVNSAWNKELSSQRYQKWFERMMSANGIGWSILVYNLAQDTEDEILWQLFGRFGAVKVSSTCLLLKTIYRAIPRLCELDVKNIIVSTYFRWENTN